ncbi:class I SAM-dependent methyltransferase [Streptomyces sp. NPDC087300]|uniref:class I SAM-dependent methyltransferase n=1 Tax=Streptomyces sp. NPDC087300 TaxID=3365780 RepID=UPI0038212061
MHASTRGYAPTGENLLGQLEELNRQFPEWHELVDRERLESFSAETQERPVKHDDFGSDEAGGRGIEYLHAQAINTQARATGIKKLLGFAGGSAERSGERYLVDLLGGDGLIRTVCEELGITDFNILTCDASPHMISAAWAARKPALLQRAERPLLKDSSVDAVLLAYGSHHVPPSDRQAVATEAARMLRPGGTFVLHDFLVGSPVDVWFEQVTDAYSETGHKFLHFTWDEITGYLEKAGFDSCDVLEIDDPYTATGPTPEAAELEIGKYLLNMYGLTKLLKDRDEADAYRWTAKTAQSIFRYEDAKGGLLEAELGFDEESDAWRITIPRRAVVGIGRKNP